MSFIGLRLDSMRLDALARLFALLVARANAGIDVIEAQAILAENTEANPSGGGFVRGNSNDDLDDPNRYDFPDLPRFFDYDCTLVQDGAVDWNELHAAVNQNIIERSPEAFKWKDTADPLLRSLDEAEAECPLGLLFFSIVRLYHTLHNDMSQTRDARLNSWSKFLAFGGASSSS